ncbi:MAG TPA: hypothetical protein VMT89_13975 [Candidatus Acidoferrales bacterium]|nr:hypothetical protein [Candidatus Acidoferrales bacterium]
MSKASRESQLSAGEDLLRRSGIADDAGVEVLSAQIGHDGASDLAIAVRLGTFATPESAEALRRLDQQSKDKLVHKEVKRALYRLDQRGVAAPEAEAEPPRTFALAAPLEGYVSAIDGRGDQLLWILKPRPAGLLHLFAVINDPDGLREIEVAETTRKGIKSIRDQMRQRHDIRMLEVDWHYCDFLIERAFRWADDKGHSVHGDYRAVRAQITNEEVQPMQPLILRYVDAAVVRNDESLVRDSERLLDQPELRTWFFTPEDLTTYLKELHDMKDSPLVLSQAQQQERFAQVIERAVEEIFGGDRQASWVRRLQEMAFFFHATAREDSAKQALAAALALAASNRGGRGIAFCEVLTRSCLAAFWQAEEQRETEASKGSLILTPAQAARETQRRR